MRVIHDTHDVLIDHFETSDRSRPPLVAVFLQRDDHQLAVHFCHRQPPRHCLAFIVLEIWRFLERTGKAIYNAQLSVRTD